MIDRLKDVFKRSSNLQALVIICAGILFYVVITNLGVLRNVLLYIFTILSPIIVAAVLTFLLNPVVTVLEKKVFGRLRHRKYLRGGCVIILLVVICILLLVLVYLVLTQLAGSVTHLISNFEGYVQRFSKMLNNLVGDRLGTDITIFGVGLEEIETSGLQNFASGLVNWVTDHHEGILGGALNIGSNVFNLFIAIMLTAYMLIDIEHVKKFSSRFFRAFMKPEKYVRLAQVSQKGSRIFLRYFASNLLDSLIIGVACYLFMIIVGLPYAALIAVLVGVCNIVPNFGPLVGGVIGSFLILILDPLGALWFVIYEIVSQFLDANVIKPKLFGDTTGLRPMWVLAAIIIGGGLFGVVGMVLGVPLFAIVAMLVNEQIEKRLQRWDYVKEDTQEEQW